jgi:hypothetical protein
MFLLFPQASKSEIDVLSNSKWREVPGTRSSIPPFDDYAQVDINSISKNGAITTYDLVESNGNYARIEVNCQTTEFRAIRYGYFETKDRVNFSDVRSVKNWQPPSNSYQRSIQSFVCKISSDTLSKAHPCGDKELINTYDKKLSSYHA